MSRSHVIDYQIKGESIQIVEVELDPMETVIAEAGAMLYMEEGITFEAKMGDGSNLVWGSTLVSLDESIPGIPVFNAPVRGGSCGGVFFLPTGSEEFEAQLRWIRPAATKANQPYPAGFSGALDGVMAVYTPPAKGVIPVDFGVDQTGTVAISGEAINPGVGGTVNVQGTRLIPSDPLKSFSINRGTGLFTGKMKVGTKTVGFKGAVIQGRGVGRGYYTIDKVTGLAGFDAE